MFNAMYIRSEMEFRELKIYLKFILIHRKWKTTSKYDSSILNAKYSDKMDMTSSTIKKTFCNWNQSFESYFHKAIIFLGIIYESLIMYIIYLF